MMFGFNSISNRLLRANYEDYIGVLSKFLSYINDTVVIKKYIDDCILNKLDVKEELQKIMDADDYITFDLGETTKEEVSNIYQILSYLNENKSEILNITGNYALGFKRFDDCTKAFNNRVVLILIQHIEGYLTKVGIDMGLDENVKYNITVNNGQVNLAADNSTIHATQNNGVDSEKLGILITDVIKNIPSNLSEDEIEQIKDCLEVIQGELNQSNPRKGLLNATFTGLKSIGNGIGFTASVATLYQFVQSFIV